MLLSSSARCPAENKQPGWGQRGLAASRARSALAGAVSWMPESKHGEERHHLTLLPEFPAVTFEEQN